MSGYSDHVKPVLDYLLLDCGYGILLVTLEDDAGATVAHLFEIFSDASDDPLVTWSFLQAHVGEYGSCFCVGCAIVQADNAPDCGVAQGVIHGVTVRHGEKQEEEESEAEQEVKGQEEENAQTPVRMSMDEMEVTRHCEALEPL